MSRYVFELAGEGDDLALQKLLSENPMPGEISVAFHRKPSYFYGAGVQGKFHQTLIVRDQRTGDPAGCISRAVKPVFINGKVADIGYLSNLRLKPEFRGGTLIARGCGYLRELHRDARAPVYLLTIIEDNTGAVNLLTSGRAGLPSCFDLGRYITYAINIYRKKPPIESVVGVVRGSADCLDEIIDCLHRNGREKQFYPYYSKEDFTLPGDPLRGFKVEDFFVALKNDQVAGVMGKWDQRDFKQTVVVGYGGKMKWVRHLYNLAAGLVGFSPLPLAGSELNSFYGSFIAVDGNDLQVFRALLREMYNDAAGKGYSYFLVGLHARDSLARACTEYNHLKYTSRLYAACWKDGEDFCRSWDNRVPYLEIGTL